VNSDLGIVNEDASHTCPASCAALGNLGGTRERLALDKAINYSQFTIFFKTSLGKDLALIRF